MPRILATVHGILGTPLDTFVAAGAGGLSGASGLVFGPDGNLYVTSDTSVLRYDGVTGAFLNTFVPSGSGGLAGAQFLTFAPNAVTTTTSVPPPITTTTVPPYTRAEIGVIGKRLIILDNLTAAGKAKIVYVSKDQAAGITKGTGISEAGIDATLDYSYDGTAGRIFMQAGILGATEGWKVNKTTVAKFVNKAAPSGTTVAKVGVIKPGKLLEVVGKGLGDGPVIDIFSAGAPSGDVHTAFTVNNASQVFSHCSTFTGCTYKLIAAGTGAKLVCKTSTADPSCAALGSPSGAFLDEPRARRL